LKVRVWVKPPVLILPVMRLSVPLPLPFPLMVKVALLLATAHVLAVGDGSKLDFLPEQN